MSDRPPVLDRIERALEASRSIALRYAPDSVATSYKSPGDPVTEVDLALDALLREMLPSDGEGWLSEETVDAPQRLACRTAWVVDPLDGTREFVAGVPEWCISIGYVVDGRPTAGGICNPVSGETVIGAVGHGVWLNGKRCRARSTTDLGRAEVLASRSETRRGEWERFARLPFTVRPCGSVAYKLALVAAGLADATWTLTPKHEWDVAAGVALVLAAGGSVWLPDGAAPRFNRRSPKLPGLVACAPGIEPAIRELLTAD